jgi:hypothetical protein
MIVAIMQPYFFPYIGYFQLMDAVDVFVFYDDAQYMKGGWVNRNRILQHGRPAWWTFPIIREDYRLPIRERRYGRTPEQLRSLLGKLEGAYRNAPHFASVHTLVAEYLAHEEPGVAPFNQFHLTGLAKHLGIRCEFVSSSSIDHDAALGGQDRVIELCRRLGATHYLNASGGRALYDAASFAAAGMELGFVDPEPTQYRQFDAPHVPFLSIVDVLMFNALPEASALLRHRRTTVASPA